MASINGITVKGLKKFKGHEGETLYQGNVYLGNKKIGWWSQDSWGGSDICYLDEPYKIRKLEEKVKELNRDKEEIFTRNDGSTCTFSYSLDVMFGDLMELKHDEDTFTKAIKNGFGGVLLVTDGYHVFGWNLSHTEAGFTENNLLEQYAKLIEEGKKEHKFYPEDKFTKHVIKIYRNINDFKVGKAINIEDIK